MVSSQPRRQKSSPFQVTGNTFRKFTLDKEKQSKSSKINKKKKPLKTNSNEDQLAGRVQTWIECDACKNQVHRYQLHPKASPCEI